MGAVLVGLDTGGVGVLVVQVVAAGIAEAVAVGVTALDGYSITADAENVMGAVLVGLDACIIGVLVVQVVAAGVALAVAVGIQAGQSVGLTADAVDIMGAVEVAGDACIVGMLVVQVVAAGIAEAVAVSVIALDVVGHAAAADSAVGAVTVGGEDDVLVGVIHVVVAGIAEAVAIGIVALDLEGLAALTLADVLVVTVVDEFGVVVLVVHMVATGIALAVAVSIVAVHDHGVAAAAQDGVGVIAVGDDTGLEGALVVVHQVAAGIAAAVAVAVAATAATATATTRSRMDLLLRGLADFHNLTLISHCLPGERMVEIHLHLVADFQHFPHHAVTLGGHHRHHRADLDLLGHLVAAHENLAVELQDILRIIVAESGGRRKLHLKTIPLAETLHRGGKARDDLTRRTEHHHIGLRKRSLEEKLTVRRVKNLICKLHELAGLNRLPRLFVNLFVFF